MSSIDLVKIASLLQERNAVDEEIARTIGRPMTSGHLGECIAAEIFGIDLENNAAAAAIDGHFRSGPLDGMSVNVKWYLKREGLLDLTPAKLPDYYLVMAGPVGPAASTRGTTRPWCIASVHLFDARALVTDLESRKVKIGVASSVRADAWRAAEIYPEAINPAWTLTAEQTAQLRQFSPVLIAPPASR